MKMHIERKGRCYVLFNWNMAVVWLIVLVACLGYRDCYAGSDFHMVCNRCTGGDSGGAFESSAVDAEYIFYSFCIPCTALFTRPVAVKYF